MVRTGMEVQVGFQPKWARMSVTSSRTAPWPLRTLLTVIAIVSPSGAAWGKWKTAGPKPEVKPQPSLRHPRLHFASARQRLRKGNLCRPPVVKEVAPAVRNQPNGVLSFASDGESARRADSSSCSSGCEKSAARPFADAVKDIPALNAASSSALTFPSSGSKASGSFNAAWRRLWCWGPSLLLAFCSRRLSLLACTSVMETLERMSIGLQTKASPPLPVGKDRSRPSGESSATRNWWNEWIPLTMLHNFAITNTCRR
mmetsp:Transcript_21072/g.45648  ORF Transcript_21072/g.45648 Transcript_21072/m.45648 type:complete len:257 (+) Transcript_21072:399-1169(+)